MLLFHSDIIAGFLGNLYITKNTPKLVDLVMQKGCILSRVKMAIIYDLNMSIGIKGSGVLF